MKLTAFLLWFVLSVMSGTQSTAPPGDRPVATITGSFFALSVADVKASAEWYANAFGLKTVMPASRSGKTTVTVLEGGGLIVELIQHDDALPMAKAAPTVTEPRLVHGLFKAGFIVDDFDKTLAALKARHIEIAFGPFPARPGQRANVIVRDNAGNLIQIFGR